MATATKEEPTQKKRGRPPKNVSKGEAKNVTDAATKSFDLDDLDLTPSGDTKVPEDQVKLVSVPQAMTEEQLKKAAKNGEPSSQVVSLDPIKTLLTAVDKKLDVLTKGQEANSSPVNAAVEKIEALAGKILSGMKELAEAVQSLDQKVNTLTAGQTEQNEIIGKLRDTTLEFLDGVNQNIGVTASSEAAQAEKPKPEKKAASPKEQKAAATSQAEVVEKSNTLQIEDVEGLGEKIKASAGKLPGLTPVADWSASVSEKLNSQGKNITGKTVENFLRRAGLVNEEGFIVPAQS